MIQPGLERIGLLLKDVHFPWKAIHVAGTNGKGSVCAYASALITRRTMRVGRFTSPHTIDRWDCINFNDKPVAESKFRKVENYFLQLNERESINASEFEILTATAFQLFNDANIEVGVVEVGMGGTLDATNILNNQAVSVIAKIARDHQNFLGDTTEEIALHKAGILRPNVPYIVNPINEWNVHDVINGYAKKIGAGPLIDTDTDELKSHLFASVFWRKFADRLEPFRRDNAVLAYLAVVETLKSMDLSTTKVRTMLPGIKNKAFPGRFQYLRVKPVFGPKYVLVDGAHNTDAALALEEHVKNKLRFSHHKSARPLRERFRISGGRRVTWVIAMTDGKDAHSYLTALLQAGDTVVTTSFGPVDGMPWVKPMDPTELLNVARRACPDIIGYPMTKKGAFRALYAAKYLTGYADPVVVTGSLYLVGDLLRDKAKYDENESSIDVESIDIEERNRANGFLSSQTGALGGTIQDSTIDRSDQTPYQDEEERLDREIDRLLEKLRRLEQKNNALESSRLLELQGDIATADYRLTSESDSPSLKQKFSTEFETIRKQLQGLPGFSPAPTSDLAGARPNSTDSIVPESSRVRIRTHLARDEAGEKPITASNDQIAPSPHKPTKLQPTKPQDQAEIKVRLVNSNAKPGVTSQSIPLDNASLDGDKTNGEADKVPGPQQRRDTQTIQYHTDPRMSMSLEDDGQSNLKIQKHMAYNSKKWLQNEKRLPNKEKVQSKVKK